MYVQTDISKNKPRMYRRNCSRRSAIICTYSTLVTYNEGTRGMRTLPNIRKTRPPFHVIPFEMLEVTETLECIRGRRVTRSAGGEVSKCNLGTHRLQPTEENLIVTNSCLYLRLPHHELSLRHCSLVSSRL